MLYTSKINISSTRMPLKTYWNFPNLFFFEIAKMITMIEKKKKMILWCTDHRIKKTISFKVGYH